MIDFLLNEELVSTSISPATTLLDFLRYQRLLKGTKCGCREGDCGACTVLIGSLNNGKVSYQSMTSCLLPLANVQGKHIVTVEGINTERGQLTLVQEALAEEGGSQCGFCTPGFVMSLTGYCINNESIDRTSAISAIDGNICRCTGYKSIERAIDRINAKLQYPHQTSSIDEAIQLAIVPEYFSGIAARLADLRDKAPNMEPKQIGSGFLWVGGGTDLYVQKAEEMLHQQVKYASKANIGSSITKKGTEVEIRGNVTVSELMSSPIIQSLFPFINQQFKLISSTPIRNMATVAGNLVNASPIGDLSIWLLALDARLVLEHSHQTRVIALRDFFLGYKQLAKSPDELVQSVRFAVPQGSYTCHFEKVSKRTYLDIASVNSAFYIEKKDGLISRARLSAGGVAPIPLFLTQTSSFLEGKYLSDAESLLPEADAIMQTEISPISDVRGSEVYKRLLLRQLLHAHLITCCAV